MIEEKEELTGELIASGEVIASLIAEKGNKGDKGDKGDTGNPGADGFSPVITTSKSGKVTTVTIVDAEGTTTATINDGDDGADGQDGNDGFSPIANVTKSGGTATITITDAIGTTTASISDGIGDMNKSVYDTNDNGIVDNAEKVNNHTVAVDVPADAVFTDTTYTAGTGIEITAGNVINNTQTSAEWGNISGTLSNQTDLNTALSGKANSSDLATVATSGSYSDLSNKPSIPTKTSDLTNDSNFEVNTNKVTSISGSSTDTQYASAKCVYDAIQKMGITFKELPAPSSRSYAINLFNDLTKGAYIFRNPSNYSDIYIYTTANESMGISNTAAIFLEVFSTFEDAEINDTIASMIGVNNSGKLTTYSLKKGNSTTISVFNSSGNLQLLSTNRAQTISGAKTFSIIPQVSSGLTPSNNYDLATKKYVDENGVTIPIQDTAPQDPEENDLWIDTSGSGSSSLIDFFYPVGSYYETSNTSFDPNITWGGTWVEDTYGRVTVAYQSDNTPFNEVGKVGGEQTHTLTINEMPSHNHGFDQPLGRYYSGADDALGGSFDTRNNGYSTATQNAGGGQAHNNLQPYIVVKRWHRTA